MGLSILPWGTMLSGSVGELAAGQGGHKSQGCREFEGMGEDGCSM